MKLQVIFLALAVVVSLLLIWGFFANKPYPWDLQESEKYHVKRKENPKPDCNPPDHYPFLIRSGLANIVGPKICFNNKIIMGGVMDNIGWGLNIVVVKGETGEILKSDYFNTHSDGLLEFLKSVQSGNIVFVASFEDPAVVLTDEIREIFASTGSTFSHSVKRRDTWVFAGAAGMVKESPFEKLVANDEKRNVYGGWPEMREVGGCFPRKI